MDITHLGDMTHIQLHHPRLSLSVGFYQIDGLLIDTGPPSHKKSLRSYLRDQSIMQAVLTHHHEDHSGLAGWLQREKNVPIYMLKETQGILKYPPRIPFYRRVAWGQMEKVKGITIGSKIETPRYSFKVIHTPGHCSDHLCLLEPQYGYLFTGDLFVSRAIKYSLRNESLWAMLNSIKTCLSYDFDSLYCAHAGPIKKGRQALVQKKEYLEDLVGQVVHLHQQGLELKEIREKIYTNKDWRHVLTGGEFSSYNVIRLIIEEFAPKANVDSYG